MKRFVKVAGRWRYVYRAVDQYGRSSTSTSRQGGASAPARWFFAAALGAHGEPVEIVTDRAPALLAVVDELIPTAVHNMAQYANNRIEADPAGSRRGSVLKRDHSARVIMRGHDFVQNLRRGHYELAIDARAHRRVAAAFTELARVI